LVGPASAPKRVVLSGVADLCKSGQMNTPDRSYVDIGIAHDGSVECLVVEAFYVGLLVAVCLAITWFAGRVVYALVRGQS